MRLLLTCDEHGKTRVCVNRKVRQGKKPGKTQRDNEQIGFIHGMKGHPYRKCLVYAEIKSVDRHNNQRRLTWTVRRSYKRPIDEKQWRDILNVFPAFGDQKYKNTMQTYYS